MSDVVVGIGVVGKDAAVGAFREVGAAGKQMGETFGSIALKLAGLAVGYYSVTTAIGGFHGALTEAGKLADFSDQTGIAVDKLVLLQRAFQNNGMAADDVGASINKMQIFLSEAADRSSDAAMHLSQMGLSFSDLKKLSPDEQFKAIAVAITNMVDQDEKVAASKGIFGKSGPRLAALLKDVNGEMEQAATEVGTYATIMGMSAKEFDALGDKIENGIGKKLVEFSAGALSESVGGLKELADKLAAWDAAAFGQKVMHDMSEPLKAFSHALSIGEFSAAFELIFQIVRLQSLKMIDELVRVGRISAAGIVEGFNSLFISNVNENTPFVKQIKSVFEYLGLYIEKILLTSMSKVLEKIPLMGDAAKSMMEAVNGTAEKHVNGEPIRQISDDGLGSVIIGFEDRIIPAVKGLNQQLTETADTISNGWEPALKNVEGATIDGIAAMAGAAEKNRQVSTAVADQQERVNKLTKEGLALKKKEDESVKKPTTAAGSAGAGGGSGGGSGGGHWNDPKKGSILPDGNLTTGIFKNTTNLSKEMQADLMAASNQITKTPIAQMAAKQIAAQEAIGNYGGAASLSLAESNRQGTAAEAALGKAAQNQTARDFNAYAGTDERMSKADQVSAIADKLGRDDKSLSLRGAKEKAEAMYDEQTNKNKGPLAQDGKGGAGGGGSGGSGGKDGGKPADPFAPMLSKLTELLNKVTSIHDNKLPFQALS